MRTVTSKVYTYLFSQRVEVRLQKNNLLKVKNTSND